MFDEILKNVAKPNLYAQSTDNLWDDEHISKGMLEAHLNPDVDAASRNHEFLDKSVDWISKIAPPSQYGRLLDLGCGPGLYAERFDKAGYSVTGMDFSRRSIAYATKRLRQNSCDIDYRCQNYLLIDYTEQFDIVTLIYCDYAALPITDRKALLGKIRQSLKPNGIFIFDVFMPSMRKGEACSWTYFKDGGFFSPEPHVLLEATYQYDDDDKTELRQNIVITKGKVSCFNIWDHFFDKPMIEAELKDAGFVKCEFYGDVAGEDFSDRGESMCVVAVK